MGYESRSKQSDRGHVLALPANAVPIIGQAFEIKSLTIATDVELLCRCDPAAPQPVLANNHAPAFCAKCRKGFQVMGVEMQPNQPPRINVRLMVPQPEPEMVMTVDDDAPLETGR